MRSNRYRTVFLLAGMFIAGVLLGSGCLNAPATEVSPTETSPATMSGASLPVVVSGDSPSPVPAAVPYGVVYPYQNTWTELERPAIRDRLSSLRDLGVDVVVQVFPSAWVDTGQEDDWFIFLDEAEAQNIRVIARLWPPHDWDGTRFDFYYVGRFLNVVQDHPALLAYFGLHEPLEEFNGDQLRAYYQEVKGYAPDLPIFHAMSSIAGFETDPRFGDRRFTDGICDLCAIWYYPFRMEGGEPVFERERVLEVLSANHALIHDRDPDAQIWFLGQAYAMVQHPRTLRMPSDQEMYALADLLLQGPYQIDGLLWYPWGHGSYDQVLGDPASYLQQQAVGTISEQYLSGRRGSPQD